MRSWESLVARLRHDWSAHELSDQFFGIPDEAQELASGRAAGSTRSDDGSGFTTETAV